MKIKLFMFLAALFLTGFAMFDEADAADDFPLRDAVECTVRGGLPNFFQKLKDGKAVKIGYLGGSITAQNGYRPKSVEWLQKQFPKAKVEGINAAIGGTGSDLGVFRVHHDVFQYDPDLLVVEFAVNDGGSSPTYIMSNMEGIVRQALAHDAEMDILFVYTFAERDLKLLQSGKYPRSASAMEKVADHYAIPTVHMGVKAAELIKEGKVLMRASKEEMKTVSGESLQNLKAGKIEPGHPIPFSGDGVHPYDDTGHVLYNNSLKRSFPKLEATGKPGPHTIPAMMSKDAPVDAVLVPVEQSMLIGDWKEITKDSKDPNVRLLGRFDKLWLTQTPGAKLKFKFKGSQFKFLDLVGPKGGMVEIKVDGKATREAPRFDHYCSYWRIQTLWGHAMPGADEHEVEITLLDKQPDRAKEFAKRKDPANLNELKEHPEKYDGTQWYVGAIMMRGELVK